MSESILNRLLQLSKLKTDVEKGDYIFRNPSLLSVTSQLELSKIYGSMQPEDRVRLDPSLKLLDSFRSFFENHISKYPLGPGPVEKIWYQNEIGKINSETAIKLAQIPEVTSSLSLIYVRALSSNSVTRAQTGQWRLASNRHKILMAAVQASPLSLESNAMLWRVNIDWIRIAKQALQEVPDGRIYHNAMKVGNRTIEEAKKEGDDKTLGDVYVRLGALNADPYITQHTGGFARARFEADIKQWHQNLYSELGQEITSISKEEMEMPTPEEAMKTAEGFYRQAITYTNDRFLKGLCLKKLSQVIEAQALFFYKPTNVGELITICQDALGFLDAKTELYNRLELYARLKRWGYEVEKSEILKILQISPDELVATMHPVKAMGCILVASELFCSAEPNLVLSMLKNSRSLFSHYGSEDYRINRLRKEIFYISNFLAPKTPKMFSSGGLDVAKDEILARSKREKWLTEEESASLIQLVCSSQQLNAETEALPIIEEVRKRDPKFSEDYNDALIWLTGAISESAAVKESNCANYTASIHSYSIAIEQYLKLGLRELPLNCLLAIEGLSTQKEVLLSVITELPGLFPSIENFLGEPGARRIQSICKKSLAAAISQDEVNPADILQLIQVAKGVRFSQVLFTPALFPGSKLTWVEDDKSRDLLRLIEQAKSALPPNSPALIPSNPEILLDENTLLTACSLPADGRFGNTPEIQLLNLQRRYDQYLSKQLFSSGIKSGVLPLYLFQDLQSDLDERTVLLDYYIGATASGNLALYVMGLTREDFSLSIMNYDVPDQAEVLEIGGIKTETSPLALEIAQFRKDILDNPEDEQFVASEAAIFLEDYLVNCLGHFVPLLDELKQKGKDHLCIVPHGPLHYFPFHLLGKPGKPLANDWIVTYLPNLQLLKRQRFLRKNPMPENLKVRPRTITAFGLSFLKNNPFHLPFIAGATEESEEIAEIFGEKPIPENEATEDALLDALEKSRYVHLLTHGRHNVYAPAFHCIYLAPDDKSDGILNAHELLSYDFSGVEILTLGACETALGRFDISDNLQGLPASFFMCGVSTIVGTLWPAEQESARYFFKNFYSRLKADANRLDAFYGAQSDTRKRYPQYRDWGAFYFMGDW